MKKIICVLLAVMLIFALTACGEKAETDTKADAKTEELTTVNKGKLTVSTSAGFPPYEMVADDGSFIGIDMEVAGIIADKLGLELQIDDMDFTAALEAAQTGKSDIVMAGVTVNETRLAVMDFTNSYATGVQVVIVKEGSEVTLDNMGDYMIGTQAGTTGYIYCSDTVENGGFGEEHVVAYDLGAQAVQALVNGQVDCVVIDDMPAQEFVKENPGLTILETAYTEEHYAIGTAKGNTAMVEAINKILEEITADGSLQKVVDKYISAK